MSAHGVYLVSDEEVAAGSFRVAPGPAVRVVGLDTTVRGVMGGAAQPVYVVSDPAGRGVMGGAPLVVANLTGVRAPDKGLAIPIYIEGGHAALGPCGHLDWRQVGSYEWPFYQACVEETLAGQESTGTPEVVTSEATTAPATVAAAVLLPDGRVYIGPRSSTSARIYDPETDTNSTPSGTFPGTSNSHLTGCLLLDGRVFLCPHGSLNARIYDPVGDELATVSTAVAGSAGAFNYGNCVTLPNGKVFIAPYSVHLGSNVFRGYLFDPNDESFEELEVQNVPGENPSLITLATFGGGVLMPNGKVFLVPYNTPVAQIFDPQTGSFTQSNAEFPEVDASLGCLRYFSGLLMADGRIFLTPRQLSRARIYDPETDTSVLAGGTYPTPGGGGGFWHSALLPNGKIFVHPYNTTHARIYDPVADDIESTISFHSANTSLCAVMLKDGRVLSPFYTTGSSHKIYDPKIATPFNENVPLSAYWNKQ